jgi:hypothetical protein
MNAFDRIKFENEQLAISLVEWGIVRRSFTKVLRKVVRFNRIEYPEFVPRYELAIFSGEAPSTLKKPITVFYYIDEDAAVNGWNSLKQTLQSGGIVALASYLFKTRLDFRKEFSKSFLP